MEKITYCRICEPLCGLVATVQDGRITQVRGDKDNPLSQGFRCIKSTAMLDVTYDPDRVLQPLRRTGGPGEFEPVSWDEALADIAARLNRILRTLGPRAFATYFGNPPGFHSANLMALEGFQAAIGSPWKYSLNGEDAASALAASGILFGSETVIPRPDLWRTDFALIVGANPYISRGSLFTEPRLQDALKAVVDRGGRVVVIDPRRTETAQQFEHVAIRSGSDAWLLAAMLHVIFAEGLTDRAFLDRWTTGAADLEAALAPFTPQAAQERCGIPAETIAALARELAKAPSAVVYGRTGTCTQRFGTLNNLLQHLLTIVTGNLERAGGALFGWSPIDLTQFAKFMGVGGEGETHSRVQKLPRVLGALPSQALAADITTPGDGQIRSLLMMGANPVLTSGAGSEIAAALAELELFVSLDFYVNETNRLAHYVLPVPTSYERADFPLVWLSAMLRPTLFATEAVIDRIGDTREESEILDELTRRMGLGGPYMFSFMRRLAKLGVRPTPRTLTDLTLRLSPAGDLFGLRRSGMSWKKLVTRHPHGLQLRDELPTGQYEKMIRTPSKRIPLASDELLGELRALLEHADVEGFPLRAHGMREPRSHNSWMHNSGRLMPPTRQYRALVNPADVAGLGVQDGDEVLVTSATASVRVPVKLTEDQMPGNVALPHGWGHGGGWQRANAAGGINSNVIASGRAEDVERLAGMSILNGIPVRIERVPSINTAPAPGK